VTNLGGRLRGQSLAILSLVIALTSFSYSAWRTERSEQNRTTRQAAFQMLVALSQMQEVVYRAHYDHDTVRGSPRTGWVYVQTISDFSASMPPVVSRDSQALLEAWRDHWEGLGTRDEDANAISDAVDHCRASVVESLRALR
jgi:type II secretory pathway pseudopilin PulG